MTANARAQIDAHRLMRKPTPTPSEARVEYLRSEETKSTAQKRKLLITRTLVHVGAFLAAFVFTAGVALLGIVLWVRPDELLPLVLVSVFCALVFVTVFAMVRVVVLHKLMNLYPSKEEDPGMEHHISKSVAYGFLALVLALLITGLLVNFASAFA
jgi:hypothetical protein